MSRYRIVEHHYGPSVYYTVQKETYFIFKRWKYWEHCHERGFRDFRSPKEAEQYIYECLERDAIHFNVTIKVYSLDEYLAKKIEETPFLGGEAHA